MHQFSNKFAALCFLEGKLVNSIYLFIYFLAISLLYFFFCSIVPFQICLNETNILCVYVYIDKVSKELQKKVFFKSYKKEKSIKKGSFFPVVICISSATIFKMINYAKLHLILRCKYCLHQVYNSVNN